MRSIHISIRRCENISCTQLKMMFLLLLEKANEKDCKQLRPRLFGDISKI